MSSIPTVTLKNGSVEAEPLVRVAMASLKSLMEKYPIAFYELVMLCRDHNHQLFGNAATILKDRALIESDGQPHDSMRNIVMSAVEGEEMKMKLSWPIKEK